MDSAIAPLISLDRYDVEQESLVENLFSRTGKLL
jgi:hypothetical protein